MEMSRLTRDGTAEPVPRDQILRREREQGNIHFPVQRTTCRVGNLSRLIHTVAICDDHIYIHTYDRWFCLSLSSYRRGDVVKVAVLYGYNNS